MQFKEINKKNNVTAECVIKINACLKSTTLIFF